MTGTQISAMTPEPTLPDGGVVPFVVPPGTVGFDPQKNYIYDLGADLLTRVSYTALASSTGGAMVGFEQTAGALLRALDAKVREFGVSIADFGADGTGTDPAADTAAIIAAHDALPAEGGPIFFPDGIYETNATITFTKRVALRGNGCSPTAGGVARCQIYKGATVAGPMFEFTALGSSMSGIGCEGLSGNTGDGLHIMAGRFGIDNCSIHRMGQEGVRWGDAAGSNCNLMVGSRVFTRENGRHGCYIHDANPDVGVAGANCNGGVLTNWETSDNGGDGMKLEQSWFMTIVGLVPQTNAGDGLNIVAVGDSGARYTTVVGGEQDESNTGFNINNSGYRTSLIGVTPGTSISDTGTQTNTIGNGINKLFGLTTTNTFTSENSSGTTFRPIVARNYGNAANGRGVGYEYQIPNGSGTSRAGAYTLCEQEATNKDNLTVHVNISGVMTKAATFSGNTLSWQPGANNTWALGQPTFQYTWVYLQNGVRVNNVQVVGARNTGWAAMTGTAVKTTIAAAAAGTASASYVQSELQGALNRIAAMEARMKAYDDALFAHGLIGA